MNTKQLRQKILDLAIKGKLVPQDENDEPAEKLLEKIRAEKEQLIKDGKIKRDKKESRIFVGDDKLHYEQFSDGSIACIEDEISFEIPNNWVWTKLPCTTYFQEGPGILGKDFRSSGIPLIRISGMQTNVVKLTGCNYLDPQMVEKKWKHFLLDENDIVISSSASIDKVAIVTREAVNTIPYTGLIRFKMIGDFSKFYFITFLKSKVFLDQINLLKTGNCIQHFGPTHLYKVLIPIPPLAEQERIAKTVEELLALVDKIEENKTDLAELIKQTKSKVLDLAIKGKLVPQDENDEPAEKLLEKIRAEKEQLLTEGKIKRDKNESYIFKNSDDNSYYEKIGKETTCIEDDLPFEIPATWRWERGKNIFKGLKSTKPKNNFFYYIDIDAIDNKVHKIKTSKKIATTNAPSRATRYIEAGDTIFSMVRPYLENIALVTKNFKECIASTGFYICSPFDGIISKYIFYLMTTKYVVNGLNYFMKGDNSPSINGADIEEFLYPIPPIAEQKQIAKKIETIFENLDNMFDNI